MTSPVRIIVGDCLEAMRGMDAASVDAIVTDPPYGLSFMGKHWDQGVPGVDFWVEALRVAKPGTHLLAFGGTRTYHRLACAIEDAGWEVRDCIAWVYGSGFPKSLNVSKAIDATIRLGGSNTRRLRQTEQETGGDSYVLNGKNNGILGESKKWDRKEWFPTTDLARQWSGWGTSLKPAFEPIIVARKPLIGTVAENVTTHGTGAMNIDGCRVQHNEECRMMAASQANIDNPSEKHRQAGRREATLELKPEGRWPANLIHDGSDEVLAAFPQAKGQQGAVGPQYGDKASVNAYGDFGPRQDFQPRGDTGSAARFFYCAKASKADRGEGNAHPTVKPTDLMRYLCRLVTPPGGIVFDPFAGSGSTGKGAVLEGFNFIGIELDAEYAEIARARIGNATSADKGLFA